MFMIMQMFCSTQCEFNPDIPKLSIVMVFCENCSSYIPEILYDTETCNFTSGEDNCASKMYIFFQCACANLCSVKWRNGNRFYLIQKF